MHWAKGDRFVRSNELPVRQWNCFHSKLASNNKAAIKVSKGAKIGNRYNQVPHLTQDNNGKVTNSQQTPQTRAKRPAPPPPPPPPQQATTKHTQTDAHKDTANTRQNKNTKDPQKKYRPGTASKRFYCRAQTGPTAPSPPPTQMLIKTHRYLVCMKDPKLINASSPKTYKSRYNKEIKQR